MLAEPSTPRTKIIGTIGPASAPLPVLERMIAQGMSIARVNLTHSDFEHHHLVVGRIRAAAANAGRSVAIWGDLPGPKMRVHGLGNQPLHLEEGQTFILHTTPGPTGAAIPTSVPAAGHIPRVAVHLPRLSRHVRPGHSIYLNDGFIQLQVQAIHGPDIHCQVLAGGELRHRDGVNLPGIDLGLAALTAQDRECLAFAARERLEAISPSFIRDHGDIVAVRQAAADLNYAPFVLAKIERAPAVADLEAILQHADAVVVARGDLGIETPLEEIALLQKRIIRRANAVGKSVITATHMLESMIHRRLPTRAEATDVANAILDGTDCLTLSAETARGQHPVEAVAMMARIARATEPHAAVAPVPVGTEGPGHGPSGAAAQQVALEISVAVQAHQAAAVVLLAASPAVAVHLSRLRLPVWTIACCPNEAACQGLHFSSGVQPVHLAGPPGDWPKQTRAWLRQQGLATGRAILCHDTAPAPGGYAYHVEVIDLSGDRY